MALLKTSHPTAVADERPSATDCPALIERLSHPSAEQRRWAARDLADCRDCSDALLEHLRRETDASVRGVMFTTLIRIGEASAVAGLVGFLRSDDTALRNETIEAMKQLPQAVAPIMEDLLHDPDSDVRIFAVNVLESLRHPHVEAWLCEVIEHDPHVNVCGTALDLLGEVGSRSASASLSRLKARFEHEPYIQFAADLAIQRILEG